MFPKTTEYAFRAMARLAANPHAFIDARTIARELKAPPSYLAKALRNFARFS